MENCPIRISVVLRRIGNKSLNKKFFNFNLQKELGFH
jgi:hypothetical protein